MSLPPRQGLYDPAFEHDACGLGFVATLRRQASHAIVRQGLQILEHLTHRGAAGSDPLTGDGAGILMQIPHRLFEEEMAAEGIILPAPGDYAVAMCFFSPDPAGCRHHMAVLEAAVMHHGQDIIGWRTPPVVPDALGPSARDSMPSIRQLDHRPQVRAGIVRAGALHHPQARRAEGQLRILLHLLLLGAHPRLQGADAGRAAGRVLPGPGRPPHRKPAGPGPLPVLHQHLPVLEAGPPVPPAGAQRRDQHPARQPGLDVGPGVHAQERRLQQRRGGGLPPDRSAGRIGLPGPGPGRRLPAPGRRPQPAPRHDDAGARGVEPRSGHVPGEEGLLRVPRLPAGALGRARRPGLLRRPADRRHPGPQRPAPGQVGGDHRRPGGDGQRVRRAGPGSGPDRTEGPAPARQDVHGGRGRRPAGLGRGDQAPGGLGAALRPVAGPGEDQPGRTAAGRGAEPGAGPRSCRCCRTPSATPRRTCAWCSAPWPWAAKSRWGPWASTSPWRCFPKSRSCCSATSSSTSPR